MFQQSFIHRHYHKIKIRYFEEHKTRSLAAKREAQIKGWSRTKKLALLKGDKGILKAAAGCKSR
jgi:predicted GIY-YIG superfamily endonuclease